MSDQNSGDNNAVVGLYATPAAALKSVVDDFQYWSGRLTETSAQMSYAVIAGNWVVFGSVNGILGSVCAKLSLVSVLLGLAASVVGTWILSEDHRKQAEYGDCRPEQWKKEFEEFANKCNPWPFTRKIEKTGRQMRRIKAGFTLAGGLLLIIGALVNTYTAHPAACPAPAAQGTTGN